MKGKISAPDAAGDTAHLGSRNIPRVMPATSWQMKSV